MIKVLLGGSPCTFWSIAQKNGRETQAQGMGWELFKNYLIAKKKFNPDFFLYENNKSAAQPIKDQISQELEVPLMYINSALVSAQNRQRFYAFNWFVDEPEDRGVLLRDILESGVIDREKSYPLLTTHQGNARDYFQKQHAQIVYEPVGIGYRGRMEDGKWIKRYESNGEPKANALTTATTDSMVGEPVNITSEAKPVYEVKDGFITIKDKKYPIKLVDGYYLIRKLTPVECERLQTLPDGYTKAVSNAQRYKGLGNGWTAEVIIHILNGALKDVPRDEEIVVLSMYDGIGTGRYCLDKMGFTNVKYFAYEIDKYAKQVAMSNYPDIIQLGDAFDVRHPDWTIGY